MKRNLIHFGILLLVVVSAIPLIKHQWREHQLHKLYESTKTEAERGSALAQLHLGEIYDEGKSTVRNPDAAAHWFLQASKQGCTTAKSNLFNIFEHGGVESGPTAELIDWFFTEAQRGNAAAQYHVSRTYFHPSMRFSSTPAEKFECMSWLIKSAEGGYSEAQLVLSQKYTDGEDIERDEAKGQYWLQKAMENERFAHGFCAGFFEPDESLYQQARRKVITLARTIGIIQ